MDAYISNCIKGGNNVAVILVNGFQMRGRIVALDTYSVTVKSEGVEKLVFKHAISTIQPA